MKNTYSAVTRPAKAVLTACLATGMLLSFAGPANAANTVAHWTLDEGVAPFADATTNNVTLYLDPDTTTPGSGLGVAGLATRLDWAADPGTSTRLYATNAAIQTDSYGFSLWILPDWVNDWDNLIVKEMPYDAISPDWSKQAWQLHFLGHDSNGKMAIEFVERGSYRTNDDHTGFFGLVTSDARFSYQAMFTNWVHLAGGYNAVTGDLFLYVDGVQFSATGTPGATNSEGSPLSIGSAKNGDNLFVNYAAGTWIDDIRMFDAPPTPAEVAALRAERLSFRITKFQRDAASGDLTIEYPTSGLQSYTVYAATNLAGPWTAVTNLIASTDTTTNVLPAAQLNTLLGSVPGAFVRVSRP